MLNYIIKFVLALFKLAGKIGLILLGLIFSAFGNALATFLSDNECDSEEVADSFGGSGCINDKNSAINAFAAGECGEAELAHYWNLENK